MAQGRLNRVVNPTFDITKVVAIERASISEHSEVYNDGSFIEYECVYKDSCLDLVNQHLFRKMLVEKEPTGINRNKTYANCRCRCL